MADSTPPIDLQALVGTWRHSDPEWGTTVRISVERDGPGFVVSAIDGYDEEKLVVTEVTWNGRSLGFAALVPSTDLRTHYEIEPGPPGELIVRFTVLESWVRD